MEEPGNPRRDCRVLFALERQGVSPLERHPFQARAGERRDYQAGAFTV
jgi:hypothetical protein